MVKDNLRHLGFQPPPQQIPGYYMLLYLPIQIIPMRSSRHLFNNGKGVPTEMWAFALPLWAYVLVSFCPMGFCPDTGGK